MGLNRERGPLLGDVEGAEIEMHSVGRAPVIGVLRHFAAVIAMIVAGVIGVIVSLVRLAFMLGGQPFRPAEHQADRHDQRGGHNAEPDRLCSVFRHEIDSLLPE